MDYFERKRKKEARLLHTNARKARKLRGLKAKIYNKKRYSEKAQLKKTYVITALFTGPGVPHLIDLLASNNTKSP